MVNKKGQMKIQQMAFMLIAITLFFVLVGLFMLSSVFSGVKKSAAELEEKQAFEMVLKLANSPEFSCGAAYGGQKVNCIDQDKVMGMIKNKEVYGNFWGVESLEIRKIYPGEEEVICNSQNYPNCNYFKIYSKGGTSGDKSSFATLCRMDSVNGNLQDKCEIGKIFIGF